jgi:ABC-type transport system involved in multi-copper enzyme maturation permease subunit
VKLNFLPTYPLLGKELIEQAARKRTYILRVIYAVMLFGGFLVFFQDRLAPSVASAAWVFGSGERMFRALVMMQFVGIFLFLPPMMAGAFTNEKERGTLVLLMLTDLKPWTMVLEKFWGNLIPMLTFLLLAMPLMAIAYAFGGVSPEYLWAGVLTLFLSCLQVGAIALMFSAYCSSTVKALLCTYFFGGLFYLIFQILFAPIVFAGWRGGGSWWGTVGYGVFHLAFTAAILRMARRFLVSRAFVEPRNLTLQVFKRLDKMMHSLNQTVGGIVVAKEKESLPENDPIAWRETRKRAMGKAVYLFRILVLLELPIALTVAMIFANTTSPTDGFEIMTVALGILWVIALLALSVTSASAFSAERAEQTLDVLLTTPLSGREIVQQKMTGIRRLGLTLMVPFLTLILCKAWWIGGGESGWQSPYWSGPLGARGAEWTESSVAILYAVLATVGVLIMLGLFSWLCLWIGLRAKNRFRAIMTSLIVIVVWSVVPVATADVFYFEYFRGDSEIRTLTASFSPAFVIAMIEFCEFEPIAGMPFVAGAIANFIGYGSLLVYFRWKCLSNADRYLGRGKLKRGSLLPHQIRQLKSAAQPAKHNAPTP